MLYNKFGVSFMLMTFLQTYSAVNHNIWVLIPLVAILAVIFITPKICRYIINRLNSDEKASISMLPIKRKKKKNSYTSNTSLDELIDTVGYAYNPKKDIFFSTMDAWQRNMGYCRLYDEAAAPLGMIIDCEPVYFSYDGKRWLIEFWKGQYGMTTGCEVGVYTTDWPDLNIPGVFNGTFYRCASNHDRLDISFYLTKNKQTIIKRSDKHWWLTGFKLGEFSEPSELSLDIYIKFKDRSMRKAFVSALQEAGYTAEEFDIKNTTVAIRFDKPHTKQPYTRTSEGDSKVLQRNKMFCDKYQSITNGYDNLEDKINAIKEQSPELYKEVLKIGKPFALFDLFKKIKDYLNFDNEN